MTDAASELPLRGKKIAVLMESDYYEPEILYYQRRFAEEGAEVHFLTRLWGQTALTFTGHEYKVPFEVTESFEDMDDEALRDYDAVIVPSGMVSDRLRYTDDVTKLPPATEFLQRAFAEPAILKGIICHGMWLVAPAPELVRGRPRGRAQQPARRRGQHGRDLRRRGRGRRRRPRHRPRTGGHCTCSPARSSTRLAQRAGASVQGGDAAAHSTGTPPRCVEATVGVA